MRVGFSLVLVLINVVVSLCGIVEWGSVKTLTMSNYDDLTSSGDWLILFWDEWCQHSHTYQPIFVQVANNLSEANHPLQFGAVHVVTEVDLAEHLNTTGHPVVKYKRNGFWSNYDGGRLEEEMYTWTKRMMEPAISTTSQTELEAIQDKLHRWQSSFVFVGDKTKDAALYSAFQWVARSWYASYNFLEVPELNDLVHLPKGQNGKSPFVFCMNDQGQYPIFKGPPTQEDFHIWFRENRFLVYPELNARNYVDFTTETTKFTLILVDDPLETSSVRFQAIFRNAAHSPAVQKVCRVGWVNGIEQKEYKTYFKLHKLPDYFVVHPDEMVHFHHEHFLDDSNVVSEELILEFMKKIEVGHIAATPSDFVGFQKFVSKNWPILNLIAMSITASGLVILVIAFFVMICQKGEKPKDKKKRH